MSDRSDRLCDHVLSLCRVDPNVHDREIADALFEALAVIICRIAHQERALGDRIVDTAARSLRTSVRRQTRAT